MTKEQILYNFSLFYLRGLKKSLSSLGYYDVWRDISGAIFCEKHIETGKVYIRKYTYEVLEKYISFTLDDLDVQKIMTKVLIENDIL